MNERGGEEQLRGEQSRAAIGAGDPELAVTRDRLLAHGEPDEEHPSDGQKQIEPAFGLARELIGTPSIFAAERGENGERHRDLRPQVARVLLEDVQ